MEKNQRPISEMADLWLAYQQTRNQEIREIIVNQYIGLVKLVAGRIAINLPQHVDKDDLISNGFFGLLDAVERYDPERGIKFETYAVARIRGSILDAIRSQDWVPTTVRQKARQYEKVVSQLEHRLGRSATDMEIAENLSISMNDLHSLIKQLNGCTIIPLEEFIKTEVAASESENPTYQLEAEEAKQILAKSIDKLPEKERLVVTLYYYEGLTLKEISLVMKLSEARISQLHTKAIFRLRGSLSRIKSSLV